jgi:hypothetical protein
MGFQKTVFYKQLRLTLLLLSLVLLVACHPHIPEGALMLDSESVKQRQLQTRVFQTDDEAKVLVACSALLQDLGFNIDESESELGVIVGSKDRSAVSAGQVIGSIFVALLTGAVMPVDKNQKMRACIVTKPIGEETKTTAVRVTFQRIVWDTQGKITKRECLTDPKIYQEFFEKLSKSLFLEAHEIL